VSFSDADHGVAVGDEGTIVTTSTGGTTWESASSGTTGALAGVSCADASICVALGDGGTLLRTTDGEITWTGQVVAVRYLLGVSSFGSTFTAVGSTYSVPLRQGRAVIVRSGDSGVSWSTAYIGGGFDLAGISLLNSTFRIAVGYSRSIVRTSDGLTWTTLQSGVPSFNGVFAIDENTATVVGDQGLIFRTTDGGDDWVVQTSGTTRRLKAVAFADANIGTAVGAAGTILRTTAGGATWTDQSFATGDLTSISLVDANIATIVGQAGLILRTTDGGSSWTRQSSGTTADLSGVKQAGIRFEYASSLRPH